jgi:hypothetical protein
MLARALMTNSNVVIAPNYEKEGREEKKKEKEKISNFDTSVKKDRFLIRSSAVLECRNCCM